jgi:hypothetical protein
MGVRGIEDRVAEDAERQFRKDLLDTASGVTGIASQIAKIEDPMVREAAAASVAKVTRELDDSLRRTRARLTVGNNEDPTLGLPNPESFIQRKESSST